MTKIIYNKIWFLCILIFIISFLNSNISRANEKWVNNELLVQFSEKPWNQPEGKDAFYINELSNVNSTLSDVFEKHGVVKVKIQFNVDYVLEALSNKYDKNKLEETRKHLANLRYRYLLYLNNSDQLDKLKTSLENLDVVIKTSYNKYLYPSLAPNDTDYNQQWALPYIDAEDAWDISVNANNISLAITDGGFQEDHVDLAGNVTIAWDSRDGDGEPTSGVADCDDHGTHVAGIVGAVGNNGNGVSGAFWSGNLMLYKMGSDTTPPGSRCSVASNICENAIADAIADGANIINRSYGYDGWMLDDVQNNPQVLFVNAAGNDGTDLDTDTDTQNLSAENNLIFVANITNSGALATTSNFGGNTVHLAAPGTNIRSTVPTDDYDSLSGTSMASPYVAGVAALAWSQCPTLTSAEVKTLILSSVTVDTTNLGGNVITDGFLNASDAVLDAQSLCDADGDGLTDDEEIALGTDPNNPDTDGDGLNDGDEINFYNTDPLNSDTDGDGINDNIELDNSLDPNDPTDANSDNDGDGLTNAQEILTHNTDPNNSDTDNDGLSDGYEVLTYGTDPLNSDTDGDLLNDNIEQNLNTDPNDSDTDNDGLNDGEEVYTYATDPNNADSDSDGLGDGAEVGLGTDPNDNDSDDDGLNDGEEVNTYNTNPLNADSDDDGLNDYEEIFDYETDPINPDTDGEGLLDGEEVLTHETDPLDTDTDDDNWSDYEEVNANIVKDPLKFDNLIQTANVHDFDGDGFGDVLVFYPEGNYQTILSTGSSFITPHSWSSGIGDYTSIPLAGDFNGDGKDDVGALNIADGSITVGISNGSSFSSQGSWITGFGAGSVKQLTGDFDGDSNDDIAVMDNDGNWTVALSSGTSFSSSGTWLATVFEAAQVLTGDFDEDGADDLLGFNPDTGEIQVALSTGSSFNSPTTWLVSFGTNSSQYFVGDFDGNGQDDFIVFHDNGTFEVATSLGDSFQDRGTLGNSFPNNINQLAAGDFTGDQRVDFAGYQVNTSNTSWDNATWEFVYSNGSYLVADNDWGWESTETNYYWHNFKKRFFNFKTKINTFFKKKWRW